MPNLLAQARDMIDELADEATQCEQACQVLHERVDKLRSAGLLNMLSPAQFQGGERSFTEQFEITAAIAEGCMSTSWVATVGNVHNWVATQFSSQAQAEYFADPNVFSSASFAPTGTATLTTGGMIADGRWGFLSGVDHADWVFLSGLVKDSPDDRPTGPWVMMLPIEDVAIDHDSWHVTGMSGSGSKSVVVEEKFVPAHRALFLPLLMTDQGPGRSEYSPGLFHAAAFPALVAVLAAPILGAAKGALKHWSEYTKARVVKNSGAAQSAQVATQIQYAEVAAEINAAELVLAQIFQQIDRGPENPLTEEERAAVPRDTAFAVQLLVKASNTMIASAGGTAAQLSNPIQRAWRDIQVASNHATLNWHSSAQNWGAWKLTT